MVNFFPVSFSQKAIFSFSLILLQFFGQNKLLAQAIQYSISFENAVHHEAVINIRVTNLPEGPLTMSMSRSSTGRYALHEFAKNVYNVQVADLQGNVLNYTRPNHYQWEIPAHKGEVSISYTLFADRADGTYSAIDETHAHLNMPATFMYAVGLEDRPIEINFQVRNDLNWKVATQLQHLRENIFSAPDFQYFMDSPAEISDFHLKEWQVRSNGKDYNIRMVVHHDGDTMQIAEYAEMARKVVLEQEAVFGELPDFDFGTYTFLACYLPHVASDAMEHRNSTFLTSTSPLETGALNNLGSLSHEFFHSWNVERLRPASLEPFDFSRVNLSGELWFAEGFTNYYTTLILCRAGFMSAEAYVRSLSGVVNAVVNGPGRRYFSPVGMSYQAPFHDAAASIDPVNAHNTFVSYYIYGQVLGLALDLMLRENFPNLNLDAFIRELWMKFGKQEIPYKMQDLQEGLAAYTKDRKFAENFFELYIYDSQLPDLSSLLSKAGIVLQQVNPGGIDFNTNFFDFEQGMAQVRVNVLEGSSLYNAGIGNDDIILTLDGKRISDPEGMNLILQNSRPGNRITVEYVHRGLEKSTELVFKEDARVATGLFENAGLEVNQEVLLFRQNWLNSKVNR
ncbi:M61 family metallopeptidase [soil metagenome]